MFVEWILGIQWMYEVIDMSVKILKEYESPETSDFSSVPEYLDKIATAIKSEQGAITEYDAILQSNDLPSELVEIIKEIQNDEKDHMVLLSNALERYTNSDFSDNLDEISELPYPDRNDNI